MVKLSQKDILKLANLAQLKLTPEETAEFSSELSLILDYVSQLDKVDVKGLEPTYQVTGLNNVTREDKKIDYKLDKKLLMENLPSSKDGQIKVKRMIA
ncbi:MAG: Asp-tRNA(Asn)/Glu-tRNA(Gln) amidotransferase subunit GatC [bacterium]